MELLEYDPKARLSIIHIGDDELIGISTLLGALVSTFDRQDATIVGMEYEDARALRKAVAEIIRQGNEQSGRVPQRSAPPAIED